ncbi:EAL domain-containing protein [Halomonas sp. G15]|nr:EAL domain-containing protein [Halomonas sp. G15]MCE0734589.1 EAL domain-containing protein [Halomonas sp. G15]
MAGELELDVVVEGIETEEQFRYLRDHHCETFQGYYFARPMPLEELLAFLEERRE